MVLAAGCVGPSGAGSAKAGPGPAGNEVRASDAAANVLDKTYQLDPMNGPAAASIALTQNWQTLALKIVPGSAASCPQLWGGPAPHGAMGHMGRPA
jgi:hypothetical protein